MSGEYRMISNWFLAQSIKLSPQSDKKKKKYDFDNLTLLGSQNNHISHFMRLLNAIVI